MSVLSQQIKQIIRNCMLEEVCLRICKETGKIKRIRKIMGEGDLYGAEHDWIW